MRVLILGAGGHAQVVADILLCARERKSDIEPLGYLDDDTELRNKQLLGLPVLGVIAELAHIPHDGVIVAIGDNATRKKLFEKMQQAGENMVRAIHPSAILAPSAGIASGTVVCANAVVGVNARVGANVILNTSCTVDHGNQVDDHAHISAGVHLGGGDTVIGEGALIGIGATVMPGIHIGAWSVVGAGALVHRAVPERVVVVGVPARLIRSNTQRAEKIA